MSVTQEQLQKFYDRCKQRNLPDSFYLDVINDLRNLKSLIYLWYINQEHETHQEVREIMGKNFLGIPELASCFSVTEEQLEALGEIPFSDSMLREHARTHMLVAFPGLSILDIDEGLRQAGRPDLIGGSMMGVIFTALKEHHEERSGKPAEEAEVQHEAYLTDPGKPAWLLIQIDPVGDSDQKDWRQQNRKVQKATHAVPFANQFYFWLKLNCMVNDEWLYEHTYVRTASKGDNKKHVIVGDFDKEEGSSVYVGNDSAQDGVYIAQMIKPVF